MKPDFRTTASRQDKQGLRARIGAWWQRRLAQRDERIQRRALALLNQHLLQDIGERDGMRAHAQAMRDAHYERMAGWLAR